jgi:hypothetical protein
MTSNMLAVCLGNSSLRLVWWTVFGLCRWSRALSWSGKLKQDPNAVSCCQDISAHWTVISVRNVQFFACIQFWLTCGMTRKWKWNLSHSSGIQLLHSLSVSLGQTVQFQVSPSCDLKHFIQQAKARSCPCRPLLGMSYGIHVGGESLLVMPDVASWQSYQQHPRMWPKATWE